MKIRRSILLRNRVLLVLLSCMGLGILARMIYIQYGTGNDHQQALLNNTDKYLPIPANRGNIYARDGSLLATTVPFYLLAIDPSLPTASMLAAPLDSLTRHLSAYFGEGSPNQYRERILKARREGKKYLRLSKKEIRHRDKQLMMHWPLIRLGRYVGGCMFEKVNRRFRPFGPLASRTIGHIDWQRRGVVGLEHSFNDLLQGQDGRILLRRIAGGTWSPIYDGTEVYPRHGSDLETTLDVNMQDAVHSALLASLRLHDAKYGVVIVMEVKTGAIRAMSNLSRQSNGQYEAEYNYAVGSQGVVEPGSTFKLASMLALLEHSPLNLSDSVDTGRGLHYFYSEAMRDVKKEGFGRITAQEVFEKSSNIGIAKLVVAHFGRHPQRFIEYLRSLALDQPIGIELKGEGTPYIKSPVDVSWSGTSLAWMAHGYELKMTPLQLLTLYNAVANKGRMVAPYLVETVVSSEGIRQVYGGRVIKAQLATPRTLSNVKRLLIGAVSRGTAKNIHSPYYAIAGKTGTAKKYQNGRYTEQYRASFVGYFPAEAPKYSCLVLIDSPSKGQTYGADVAAPLFRKIADRLYLPGRSLTQKTRPQGILPVISGGYVPDIAFVCARLRIPTYSHAGLQWARSRHAGRAVGWHAGFAKTHHMPNLTGMSLRDALAWSDNQHLKSLYNQGFGRITQQWPRPGTPFRQGDTLRLALK